MATNVNVDPVRAHAVFEAWGGIAAPTAGASNNIAMQGTDLLDGAAFSLLKAEFLAAQAGVVPFVPLPGGGQGVLTVGGALSQPSNKWPQPELETLYFLNHKGIASLHASVTRARPTTPRLTIPALSPGQVQDDAAFWASVGHGAAKLGVLPVAWLVVAAVGILATVAATWYATRTKLEEIQVDAKLARDQRAIGSLTDLAQQQLANTGKIDPGLIAAIRNTGTDTGWGVWPYVAIGTGAALVGGTGVAMFMRKRRR